MWRGALIATLFVTACSAGSASISPDETSTTSLETTTTTPTKTTQVEAVTLTETYGCGYGFYMSNADQTVGLFLSLDYELGLNDEVPMKSNLADEIWEAELRFGKDLFSNWCDDVIEDDEPVPLVDESWTVSGRIRMKDLPDPGGCRGPATAVARSLTAKGPNGETLSLGALDLTNSSWGCFAG